MVANLHLFFLLYIFYLKPINSTYALLGKQENITLPLLILLKIEQIHNICM